MAIPARDAEVRLARQKLAIEMQIKRSEQSLARRQLALSEAQFALQQRQFQQSQGLRSLLSPTGVVLVAAALGLIGTAIGKYADYLNTRQQQETSRDLTKQQQETSVILKASEVPSTLPPEEQVKTRARNLLWFARAHYITLPADYTKELEQAAAIPANETLAAPVIQSAAPAVDPRPVSRRDATPAARDSDPATPAPTPAPASGGASVAGAGPGLIELLRQFEGISDAQARTVVAQEFPAIYRAIDAAVTVPLTRNQRDALASFSYNTGALRQSTLLQKLNAGDYAAVPQELLKYSRFAGQESAGLRKRREAEGSLFQR